MLAILSQLLHQFERNLLGSIITKHQKVLCSQKVDTWDRHIEKCYVKSGFVLGGFTLFLKTPRKMGTLSAQRRVLAGTCRMFLAQESMSLRSLQGTVSFR